MRARSCLFSLLLFTRFCAAQEDDDFDDLDEIDELEDGPLLFDIRQDLTAPEDSTEGVLALVEETTSLKSRSFKEELLHWLTINTIKGASPCPQTREALTVELSSDLVEGHDLVTASFYKELSPSRIKFVDKSYADAAGRIPSTFKSTGFHETLAQLVALEHLHDQFETTRASVQAAPISTQTIKRKVAAFVNLVKTMQDASQTLGAKLTGEARIKRTRQSDKDEYLAKNSLYSMSLGFPYACNNGQIYYLMEAHNDPDALYSIFASLPENTDSFPMTLVLHALVHGCQQFPPADASTNVNHELMHQYTKYAINNLITKLLTNPSHRARYETSTQKIFKDVTPSERLSSFLQAPSTFAAWLGVSYDGALLRAELTKHAWVRAGLDGCLLLDASLKNPSTPLWCGNPVEKTGEGSYLASAVLKSDDAILSDPANGLFQEYEKLIANADQREDDLKSLIAKLKKMNEEADADHRRLTSMDAYEKRAVSAVEYLRKRYKDAETAGGMLKVGLDLAKDSPDSQRLIQAQVDELGERAIPQEREVAISLWTDEVIDQAEKFNRVVSRSNEESVDGQMALKALREAGELAKNYPDLAQRAENPDLSEQEKTDLQKIMSTVAEAEATEKERQQRLMDDLKRKDSTSQANVFVNELEAIHSSLQQDMAAINSARAEELPHIYQRAADRFVMAEGLMTKIYALEDVEPQLKSQSESTFAKIKELHDQIPQHIRDRFALLENEHLQLINIMSGLQEFKGIVQGTNALIQLAKDHEDLLSESLQVKKGPPMLSAYLTSWDAPLVSRADVAEEGLRLWENAGTTLGDGAKKWDEAAATVAALLDDIESRRQMITQEIDAAGIYSGALSDEAAALSDLLARVRKLQEGALAARIRDVAEMARQATEEAAALRSELVDADLPDVAEHLDKLARAMTTAAGLKSGLSNLPSGFAEAEVMDGLQTLDSLNKDLLSKIDALNDRTKRRSTGTALDLALDEARDKADRLVAAVGAWETHSLSSLEQLGGAAATAIQAAELTIDKTTAVAGELTNDDERAQMTATVKEARDKLAGISDTVSAIRAETALATEQGKQLNNLDTSDVAAWATLVPSLLATSVAEHGDDGTTVPPAYMTMGTLEYPKALKNDISKLKTYPNAQWPLIQKRLEAWGDELIARLDAAVHDVISKVRPHAAREEQIADEAQQMLDEIGRGVNEKISARASQESVDDLVDREVAAVIAFVERAKARCTSMQEKAEAPLEIQDFADALSKLETMKIAAGEVARTQKLRAADAKSESDKTVGELMSKAQALYEHVQDPSTSQKMARDDVEDLGRIAAALDAMNAQQEKGVVDQMIESSHEYIALKAAVDGYVVGTELPLKAKLESATLAPPLTDEAAMIAWAAEAERMGRGVEAALKEVTDITQVYKHMPNANPHLDPLAANLVKFKGLLHDHSLNFADRLKAHLGDLQKKVKAKAVPLGQAEVFNPAPWKEGAKDLTAVLEEVDALQKLLGTLPFPDDASSWREDAVGQLKLMSKAAVDEMRESIQKLMSDTMAKSAADERALDNQSEEDLERSLAEWKSYLAEKALKAEDIPAVVGDETKLVEHTQAEVERLVKAMEDKLADIREKKSIEEQNAIRDFGNLLDAGKSKLDEMRQTDRLSEGDKQLKDLNDLEQDAVGLTVYWSQYIGTDKLEPFKAMVKEGEVLAELKKKVDKWLGEEKIVADQLNELKQKVMAAAGDRKMLAQLEAELEKRQKDLDKLKEHKDAIKVPGETKHCET